MEENGVKSLVFEGSPYYTMHKSCDVWEYGLALDGEPLTKPAAKPVLTAPEKAGPERTPAEPKAAAKKKAA